MKKHILVIGILVLGLTILAQEIQHETIAINIEVPVRVYKGDNFVDNLTIDDFEILEEGILQNIEAVYLIRKTRIERAEKAEMGRSVSVPELTRHFLFLFELTEYLPQIKEALDEFFLNVIKPEDSLSVVTPLKTYNLKNEAFSILPRDKMAELLNKKIRKDIITGSAEYNSLLRDLRSPIMTQDLQMMILRKLRDYKQFDEKKLLQMAEYLSGMEGQKHIFLFYQKEGIPISKSMSISLKAELMRSIDFDENKIREAFSDSSISVHFLYITKENRWALDLSNPRSMRNMEIFDQSSSFFGAFKKMAQVTGGISEASANISWSFNQATQASESYYTLYYSPKNYRADGKFKKIQVKVKGKNYRVTHRAGYIAD
jgi:VWFA-related protein